MFSSPNTAPTPLAVPTGLVTTDLTTRWATPPMRRTLWVTASRADSPKSSPTGVSSTSITGSGWTVSRSRSVNFSASRMPPSPSVMVWCIFWNIAARPPYEALDDDELPQRPGALERVEQQLGGQVVQHLVVAGRRHRHPADVVVEVELGIVGPRRRREAAHAGHHPLAQAGDVGHGDGEAAAQASRTTAWCRGW